VDIGFGLGLTPPPSSDASTALADRGGAVPADQAFGDQVRHLLGAWSMETGEIEPTGVDVAVPDRTRTGARQPAADALESRTAGERLDKESNGPALTGATIVDPALWLRPPALPSGLGHAPTGHEMATATATLAAAPSSSHAAPIRVRETLEGEHRLALTSSPAGPTARPSALAADGWPANEGVELVDTGIEPVPGRLGVIAPERHEVPHSTHLPGPSARLPERADRARETLPVMTPPASTSASTAPEPLPSAAGANGRHAGPGSVDRPVDTRSGSRPVDALPHHRHEAPPAHPTRPIEGEATPQRVPPTAMAEVARPPLPSSASAAHGGTQGQARLDAASASHGITAGRRAVSRAPEPVRPAADARLGAHEGVAPVEANSSPAGTERSAAVEVTSAEGPSKPRAIHSMGTVTHVVGPTDAVEPSRPSGVTTVPADTPAAGRSSSEEPALEHQIVQSLRLHATSGGGEAQVRLRPEYLGEVTIKVVVEDGVVSARLEASVPAVRDWAERHESSLRQALGEHGLTLDTFSVHDQPSADESRERFDRDPDRDQEPRDRQRRPRRRDETAGPRFVVEA